MTTVSMLPHSGAAEPFPSANRTHYLFYDLCRDRLKSYFKPISRCVTMVKLPRMTYATAVVLLALDRGYRYGFYIIDATGLGSGTVYPLLRRLEETRLIKSKWEHVAIARSSNRPPRKYYELTPAADSVVELARDRFPALEVGPLAEQASAR